MQEQWYAGAVVCRSSGMQEQSAAETFGEINFL